MPILYTPIPTRKVHISSVLAPAQLTTRLDSLMNALNFFAYASFKENMRKFWFYILEMIPILIIAYYLYNDHDSAVWGRPSMLFLLFCGTQAKLGA
ncbi:hypothetical protein SERLA73DRAFT_68338 [Serpula lacrymans var. lacrymans S7.3]|uniref:Uncharacterized protein n=1 Tax=Serpula lacrymans var. lacrymans (strain S7.3) TaxID=936435 RepID=F8PEY4_SERL3|nr:hypothetical protein SERLA73DRAFT_68338 [Serpula lacrymans var. lacrymans S7.3]